MNPTVKTILPHLTAIAIFLVLSVAYFYPQLQGMGVNQSDITQHKGMAKEIQDHKEGNRNHVSLWTNSMFGGMPYLPDHFGESRVISFTRLNKVLTLSIDEPLSAVFLSGMLSFYILMICLGVNHWLSIIGAVSHLGLTTNSIILFEAGHLNQTPGDYLLAT